MADFSHPVIPGGDLVMVYKDKIRIQLYEFVFKPNKIGRAKPLTLKVKHLSFRSQIN
jgi:hypothetical protein